MQREHRPSRQGFKVVDQGLGQTVVEGTRKADQLPLHMQLGKLPLSHRLCARRRGAPGPAPPICTIEQVLMVVFVQVQSEKKQNTYNAPTAPSNQPARDARARLRQSGAR